ncbi:MAG: hypothetical protein M0T70_10055 [Geobacteraceae bacterium]|nr:hypothetical protein [Geobacteraceae bacterium]
MTTATSLAGCLLSCALITGCASTLPPQTIVNSGYNLEGIKTVSVSTHCPNPKLENIEASFVPDFCQMLGSSAKLAIKSRNPTWQLNDTNTDAQIDIQLEELYGGSAQARFWVGFGAGKTAITVYVKVKKDNAVLAEGRLTETSTMPNLNTGNWSNEELLAQDAPLISRKIADFIADPDSFK